MRLVHFHSLLHKIVIIFLLPEIFSKLFSQQLLALETNLFSGAFASHDRHRDMRMDIDNMSYEVLYLLCLVLPECCRDFVRGCFSFWNGMSLILPLKPLL